MLCGRPCFTATVTFYNKYHSFLLPLSLRQHPWPPQAAACYCCRYCCPPTIASYCAWVMSVIVCRRNMSWSLSS